jgi:type IV fimbrial biogenesis protein FimT
VTTVTNDLVAALNTAKVEAVKRGLPVAVISTSGSNNWTAGWQIMADTGRDGSFTTKLTEHEAVKASYSVFAKATGAGGNDSQAAFGPVGTLQSGTTFDFSVCRPSTNADITQSRRITVGGGGTISSRRDVTGSPAGTCN